MAPFLDGLFCVRSRPVRAYTTFAARAAVSLENTQICETAIRGSLQ